MRVIDEIIREINKRRWERWRAKQNKEREKSYFYCWDEWNNWHNWHNWSDHCDNVKLCPHGCADVSVVLNYDMGNCTVDAYDVAGFCWEGGHSDTCGHTLYGHIRGVVLAVNYICSPPCEGWSCVVGEKECYYMCAGLNVTRTCSVPSKWCGYDMQNYATCNCQCGLATDGCEVSCTCGW